MKNSVLCNFWVAALAFTVLLITGIFGCGGGTRGTGDLTVEGKVLSSTGAPVGRATVTFTKTGDSTVTDNSGNFLLVTKAVEDQTEFLIETAAFELISNGVAITRDVEGIVVTITIKDIDSPARSSSQEVSIKKKRGEGTSGSGSKERGKNDDSVQDDRRGDGSGDDSPPGNDDLNDNSGGKKDSGGGNSGKDNRSDDDSQDNHGAGEKEDRPKSQDEERTPSPFPTQVGNGGEKIKVERRGLLAAFDDSSITVEGIRFNITGSTEFKNFNSLDELKIGDSVEVKGYRQSSDFVAEEIKIRD